jgi:fatty-acyl-CoA synthase
MDSTMSGFPLTISTIFRHGLTIYGDSRVRSYAPGADYRDATYADIALAATRLASALEALGISPGTRVGTMLWNTREHLELYLAVPSMGAILHTINMRLPDGQLAYVINHAEDEAIVVNETALAQLARLGGWLGNVRHVIVVSAAATARDLPGLTTLSYTDLLSSGSTDYPWPSIDESQAAAVCYTSGTTGDPKGVVYSHRSTYLHSMSVMSGNVLALCQQDSVLPVVPMYHANAWGLPYASWLSGADQVMPGEWVQASHLATMIRDCRPTITAGVPTVWNGLLAFAEEHPVDLSSVRIVLAGGSAVPTSLIEGYQRRLGMNMVQGWGMTESSPLAAMALPPRGASAVGDRSWQAKTGRIVAGLQARVVDDAGHEVAADGTSVGELEIRGPWVTQAYYKETSDKFRDGWLRTGDMVTMWPNGFFQIKDRAKDMIKSGGEWISSVDLENRIMAHPGVLEAAVVAVPNAKWGERPVAWVVRRPGSSVTEADLRESLSSHFAAWQLPDAWSWVDEIPKTSVGKFDKKAIRGAIDGT